MKKAITVTGRIVGARKRDGTGLPPGLRIQFDAQPEEVLERISALLKSLGVEEVAEEPQGVPSEPEQSPEPPDLAARVNDLQRALDDANKELATRGQRIAELERILVRAKEAIAQRDAYIRSLPRAGSTETR
jgi:hypothetical protein